MGLICQHALSSFQPHGAPYSPVAALLVLITTMVLSTEHTLKVNGPVYWYLFGFRYRSMQKHSYLSHFRCVRKLVFTTNRFGTSFAVEPQLSVQWNSYGERMDHLLQFQTEGTEALKFGKKVSRITFLNTSGTT